MMFFTNPDPGAGDPASLERLHEIVVPPPAPIWPPAPGWLWLLGVIAVLALVLAFRWYSRWQKNRYRREALAELSRLESGAANTLPGLSELLKRTALTAFPRPEVAALTGPQWFAFLDRTGDTQFADGLGMVLERASFENRTETDESTTEALANEIRNWIRHHRPC